MNFKGMCGEQLIENILLMHRDKGVRYVHNMLVKKSSNSIAQIDFVVLAPSAFIVLEVKNWDCKVYIDEYSNEWLCEYDDKVVYAKNPINQNLMHLKCIYSISDRIYLNKVVFCNNTRIVGKSGVIMTTMELISALSSNKRRYTQEDIDAEYDLLINHKLQNYATYLNIVDTLKHGRFGKSEDILL